MGLPTLAIIGRPNVGKSTLFNRLAGKQLAIVNDTPGVTRDYRAAETVLAGRRVQLYDTAGLEDDKKDSLFVRMREQTSRALELSDAAVFVVDGRTGLTPLDISLAAWLRKQKKKIIVAINKCDNECPPHIRAEVTRLGLGEPLAISASHGDGILDLTQEILQNLPQRTADDKSDEKPLRLAIVGRPNAGKSTLLNALLKEQRVMTGAEPGLTRDSIAVDWEYEGQLIRIVDTAGLRRRTRVETALEKMAVTDTQRIIRLAEVAIVVMDVQTLFDKQDLQITQQIIDEGRALVLVINKWDIVKDNDRKAARKAIDKALEDLFHNAKAVPVITLSAIQGGKELHELMAAVFKVYEVWNRRISTSKLNRWLSKMVEENPPPMAGGRPLRLRYMTQVKARPPTFALWISRPDELPQSYEKFLLNHLRTDLDLPGVPLRLMRRKGENPYEGKAKT
ncbi:MAG TPA: ribosome biogenesis GTPase Der, partial [Rhodospirillaceae bacterium]|nr:ribosome biogenesis GTPase Der [Rhodospirillaceae bacterium]